MNILVLSDFFPPQVNAGAENIALELCKGYIKNDNKVSVITVNKSLKRSEVIIDILDSITCYQIGFSYNEKFSSYLGLYNPFLLKIIKKIILENEFKIANKIGFSLMEWTIDTDTLKKNPLFYKGKLKEILILKKKYKFRIESLTLDYLMENPIWKK